MRKVLVQKFFIVLMIFGLFVSCNNLSETEENLSNSSSPDSSQEVIQDSLPAGSRKALLVVDGRATESRTAFPTYDVETALDVSFHLTGKLDKGPEKLIKSWEADGNTPAYTKMTEDKNLLVDTGTWDFRLSVGKNNVEILNAELPAQQIKVGENPLNFTLKEAPSGEGNLSYTLIFPSAGVAKVRASLLDLNDATTEEPQDLSISSHDTGKKKVTYTLSNVPAGNYMVKLEIFSDNDKTDQLGVWTEVARIAPGFTTEATQNMKYLTYTVTFDKNGGTGDMGEHKFVYGIEKDLPVNTFTRTGYTFDSWNTKRDGQGKKYEDGVAYIDNASVTLYAQWKVNTYTITFDDNGGDGGPEPFKVTYGQTPSGKPSPLPKRGNQFGVGGTVAYTFTGYNTKANGTGEEYYDKDGNLVKTNWTVTKNTPLYAQWELSGGASVVAEELKKITTPGTYMVKVTGQMTSNEVYNIRDALRTLQGKLRDAAWVELDLRGTTLTELPNNAFNEKNSNTTMVWNLTKVFLPDTVTKIGKYAFDCCTDLTYVDLGKGIMSIGNQAFDYCYKLATIRVSAPKPPSFVENSTFRLRGSPYSRRTIEVPQAYLTDYKKSKWANLEAPAGTKVTLQAQQ